MDEQTANNLLKLITFLMPYAATLIGLNAEFKGYWTLERLLKESSTRCSFTTTCLIIMSHGETYIPNSCSTAFSSFDEIPKNKLVQIEYPEHTYCVYIGDEKCYIFESSLDCYGPILKTYDSDIVILVLRGGNDCYYNIICDKIDTDLFNKNLEKCVHFCISQSKIYPQIENILTDYKKFETQ
jgi:hypothetical protein